MIHKKLKRNEKEMREKAIGRDYGRKGLLSKQYF